MHDSFSITSAEEATFSRNYYFYNELTDYYIVTNYKEDAIFRTVLLRYYIRSGQIDFRTCLVSNKQFTINAKIVSKYTGEISNIEGIQASHMLGTVAISGTNLINGNTCYFAFVDDEKRTTYQPTGTISTDLENPDYDLFRYQIVDDDFDYSLYEDIFKKDEEEKNNKIIFDEKSNCKNKKVNSCYIGVDGIAKKITSIYIGDKDCKARKIDFLNKKSLFIGIPKGTLVPNYPNKILYATADRSESYWKFFVCKEEIEEDDKVYIYCAKIKELYNEGAYYSFFVISKNFKGTVAFYEYQDGKDHGGSSTSPTKYREYNFYTSGTDSLFNKILSEDIDYIGEFDTRFEAYDCAIHLIQNK